MDELKKAVQGRNRLILPLGEPELCPQQNCYSPMRYYRESKQLLVVSQPSRWHDVK